MSTYVRTFELVNEKAVSLSLSLDPEIVFGDFEQAIKQALDLSFLTAEFRGYYFHFSQALMRTEQLACNKHTEVMTEHSDF